MCREQFRCFPRSSLPFPSLLQCSERGEREATAFSLSATGEDVGSSFLRSSLRRRREGGGTPDLSVRSVDIRSSLCGAVWVVSASRLILHQDAAPRGGVVEPVALFACRFVKAVSLGLRGGAAKAAAAATSLLAFVLRLRPCSCEDKETVYRMQLAGERGIFGCRRRPWLGTGCSGARLVVVDWRGRRSSSSATDEDGGPGIRRARGSSLADEPHRLGLSVCGGSFNRLTKQLGLRWCSSGSGCDGLPFSFSPVVLRRRRRSKTDAGCLLRRGFQGLHCNFFFFGGTLCVCA